MADVIRFKAAGGVPVLVEAEEDDYGVERVSRASDGVLKAAKGLEDAMGTARATILSALAAFDGLGFRELSLEFGLKLNAEAGALIAKAGAEAQLTVTAIWGPEAGPGAPTGEQTQAQ
jgi:Trypsin-co-occurring domain 1